MTENNIKRLYDAADGGLNKEGEVLNALVYKAIEAILADHRNLEGYDIRDVQSVIQHAVLDVGLVFVLNKRNTIKPVVKV